MKGIPDTVLWRNTASLSALSPLDKKHSVISPRPSSITKKNSFLQSPALTFELIIFNVLQGSNPGWDERQTLADTVASLPNINKQKLIDFFVGCKGAAKLGIENNACKAFQCSQHQLGELLKSEDGVDRLIKHSQVLLFEIIPSLESILYPLQEKFPSFSIRRILLRSFRDNVLIRIFESVPARIPRLEHLVFTVLFESYDNSAEYARFEELSNIVLGKGI